MRVLGLNPGPHDAAAALVVDGRLSSLLEEERLSRIKRSPDRPPIEAAQACLAAAGIDLAAVDAVAIGWTLGGDTGLGESGDEAAIREWLIPEAVFGEAASTVPLVQVPAPSRACGIGVLHHAVGRGAGDGRRRPR